jgi:hypothetical protein
LTKSSHITRKISDKIVEYLNQYVKVKMWREEDIPVPLGVLEKEIEKIDGLYLSETRGDANEISIRECCN